MDQELFLETLKAIVTVAKTENNYLTKEQVRTYMQDSGIELEEEKFPFIYQYLGENGVSVKEYDFKPAQKESHRSTFKDYVMGSRSDTDMKKDGNTLKNKKENLKSNSIDEKLKVMETDDFADESLGRMEHDKLWGDKSESGKKMVPEQEMSEEDSVYLKMYLSDLENVPVLTEREKQTLWTELKHGSQSASEHLMEGYFHEVVKIAEQYRNRGVNLEDLIQEGNMALLQSFDGVKTLDTMEKADSCLKAAIKEAVETGIDTEVMDSDWEHTVLAKVNLIHEAANYLAGELGRPATVSELADYTKMTKEEIENAGRLSKDVM